VAKTPTHPYAITMWDFSWIERRWPGAGYEDWDLALDELAERGYDAVRIDAFPHLVSADPDKAWDLVPVWNQTSWGAQSPITIPPVVPALLEFIRKCAERDIKVGLSTWYREDTDNLRMNIRTPQDQAKIWIDTIRHVADAGLMDSIIYVDLCNEFLPWAPYMFEHDPFKATRTSPLLRTESWVEEWMRDSIELVRAEFPGVDLTYSFTNEFTTWREQDVSSFDLLEPHVWMSNPVVSDLHERVGYHWERFDPKGFDNIVKYARKYYEEDQERYDGLLFGMIDTVADWSRATGLGLVTTECWAMVDWKDWPGLEWDWILDLNARAVEYVVQQGRWTGIATSNFCGPQFVGMWREVEWHQRMTRLIKSAPIDADIAATRARRP